MTNNTTQDKQFIDDVVMYIVLLLGFALFSILLTIAWAIRHQLVKTIMLDWSRKIFSIDFFDKHKNQLNKGGRSLKRTT